MSNVFLLRNQHSLFLNRHAQWVSGKEAASLFRAKHKDEALNEVFEVSARDISQRIEVVELPVNEKGVPIIPAEWIVELPEPALDDTSAAELDAGDEDKPKSSHVDGCGNNEESSSEAFGMFQVESA